MAEHLITALDDPRLQAYRELKQTNLTRWSGRFIAEGVRVVQRLLESSWEVESVFISQAQRQRLPADLGRSCEVYACPQSLAELVVGYRFHAGVLACAFRRETATLDEVLARCRPTGLLVACPNTTDPDNLGSIIRIAAGFGAAGILLGSGCCDPFSRRTLRVSMGTAFTLPILECHNLLEELETLRAQHSFRTVASTLGTNALPLPAVARAPRMILLLGNESSGLPQDILQLADDQVTIPMSPQVDSLNVGVAAGILLYHFTQAVKPNRL